MKILESVALALIAVFAPIHSMIAAVMALVVADMITGVMAARKKGQKITSSGLKQTVGKIFLYEIAVMAAFLCEQYLTGDLFPASRIVAALIGLTELKSVLENLDAIQGQSVFKAALVRVTQSKKEISGDKDDHE